jgi:hypothetical protein
VKRWLHRLNLVVCHPRLALEKVRGRMRRVS